MPGFTTLAVHGAHDASDPHGSLRYPLYESAAFEFASAKDIESAFLGRRAAHSYSRISNPTVADFEKRMTLLSGGLGALAVASGMAAISNFFLAVAGQGDNVVVPRFLFGNTYSLLTQTLGRWGLEVRFADFDHPEGVSDKIDGKTRAVFAETVANPQLAVYDLAAIAALAHTKGAPLAVDSTVSTPYLFRGKEYGVDVELVSSTKYITGGATCVGGVLIDHGSFDWKRNPHLAAEAKKAGPFALLSRLRREVYRNAGVCMAPQTAWLQTLGLETLAIRIDRSCANAQRIAEALGGNPKVKSVNYPGLSGSRWHGNAAKLFGNGYGGLLTFDLASRDACFRFLDALRTVRRATNINDNKTLAIHPASTIFCEYTPEEREVLGVSETLIRLSVGIEDADDIVNDLYQALEV